MVNSIVGVEVVSTRKRRLFSHLIERDTDFLIAQSTPDEQTESRDNMLRGGTSSDNASNPAQINYPQVDIHTLEENIVSKVRSEVDNVMASVETRVQDAVLTAKENFVTPRVARKSANAHSERSVDSNVLELDQRDFVGFIKGLRKTASSRIDAHTDLNRIDESRANRTVEEGDLLVNEKDIDRQTYAYCNTRT